MNRTDRKRNKLTVLMTEQEASHIKRKSWRSDVEFWCFGSEAAAVDMHCDVVTQVGGEAGLRR